MAIQKIPNTLIADNAVTAAKIANGTLTADDIAANSITAAKLSASTSPTFGGLTVAGNATGSTIASTGGTTNNRGMLLSHQNNTNQSYVGRSENGAADTGNRITFDYDNDKMQLDSDGDIILTPGSSNNVGIGETNPDASLHITSNTPIISFDESDASQEFRIGSFGGSFAIYDSTDSAYRFVVDGSGNVAIGSTSDALDNMSGLFRILDSTGGDRTVAHFGAHNYGDTGKTFINIGSEYGDGTSRIGSFNDTGNKSVLVFDTHSATSGQFTERMRIDSSGNVGIGATSPAKPLHLKRTSGWATMRLEGASDSGGELEFYAASTKKGSIWFGNDGGFNVRVNGADDTIKINSSRVMAVGGGSPQGTNSGTIQAGGDVAATDNFTTLGTHLSLVYTAGTGQEMHISRSNGNRVATFTEGQNLLLGDITSNYLTYGALQVARGGYTAGHGGIVGFFDTDVSVASSNLIQVLSFSGDTDATGGAFIRFSDSNSTLGQITAANGTQCSYGVSSDERLKENIVDASSQLDLINNIRVREFDWKVNGYHEVGMIAQELNTVVPSVVQEGGDDITEQPWTVDYGKLTPYLIKAIQELKTELDAAKARITELEG